MLSKRLHLSLVLTKLPRCQDLLGQLKGHDNAATVTGNQPIKTCEQCFAKFLTEAQITALLRSGSFVGSTIAEVCARLAAPSPISESGFISILTGLGVSVTTANELVACLKEAGIPFTQVPT